MDVLDAYLSVMLTEGAPEFPETGAGGEVPRDRGAPPNCGQPTAK